MDSNTSNKNSLLHLLMKVGHKLHHGDLKNMEEAQLFKGLSEEEQTELAQLLTKMLASWKAMPKAQPTNSDDQPPKKAKKAKKDKKNKKDKKDKAAKKAKKAKKNQADPSTSTASTAAKN